jgi:toxin ParE1/3/4
MQKLKIEILETAWRELEEIADYHLMIVGPISAKKITDKILNALARLIEFPLSCPYVPDNELRSQAYRMLVCDPYLCIYRVVGDVVYVYHIAHGATEYGSLLK